MIMFKNMVNVINFDNNATTRLCKEALAKMVEVYGNSYNPSSGHALGREGSMIVEDARMNISEALSAQNYEVFFTAGGTEANNMALFGDDYEEILFAKFEHSSIYNTRPKNAKITEIGVTKDGIIDEEDLKSKIEALKGKNFLVSLMYSNSETGAIQPLKEIAKLVHQNGGLIHSDLVQACGKIKVDLEDLNVDFASISSHKINGPQGVGALFVRRGLNIQPIIFGGGQERGKRSGTLNVAGIAGFGYCMTKLPEKLEKMDKIVKIRDFIEKEIKKIAGDNVKIFGENVDRVRNTSFFALKKADSQTQMIHFDLNKIAISGGSACSSGSTRPSRVVEAMGVDDEFQSAIRVSLCAENTMEEAKEFIEVLKKYYEKISKCY